MQLMFQQEKKDLSVLIQVKFQFAAIADITMLHDVKNCSQFTKSKANN